MTGKAGTGEYEQKLFVRRLPTIGGIGVSPHGVGVLADDASVCRLHNRQHPASAIAL